MSTMRSGNAVLKRYKGVFANGSSPSALASPLMGSADTELMPQRFSVADASEQKHEYQPPGAASATSATLATVSGSTSSSLLAPPPVTISSPSPVRNGYHSSSRTESSSFSSVRPLLTANENKDEIIVPRPHMPRCLKKLQEEKIQYPLAYNIAYYLFILLLATFTTFAVSYLYAYYGAIYGLSSTIGGVGVNAIQSEGYAALAFIAILKSVHTIFTKHQGFGQLSASFLGSMIATLPAFLAYCLEVNNSYLRTLVFVGNWAYNYYGIHQAIVRVFAPKETDEDILRREFYNIYLIQGHAARHDAIDYPRLSRMKIDNTQHADWTRPILVVLGLFLIMYMSVGMTGYGCAAGLGAYKLPEPIGGSVAMGALISAISNSPVLSLILFIAGGGLAQTLTDGIEKLSHYFKGDQAIMWSTAEKILLSPVFLGVRVWDWKKGQDQDQNNRKIMWSKTELVLLALLGLPGVGFIGWLGANSAAVSVFFYTNHCRAIGGSLWNALDNRFIESTNEYGTMAFNFIAATQLFLSSFIEFLSRKCINRWGTTEEKQVVEVQQLSKLVANKSPEQLKDALNHSKVARQECDRYLASHRVVKFGLFSKIEYIGSGQDPFRPENAIANGQAFATDKRAALTFAA